MLMFSAIAVECYYTRYSLLDATIVGYLGYQCSCITVLTFATIVTTVFVCLHGRPRQATGVLQPAGLLYRPLWTFQLWPPDAPAPGDAFRTLVVEVGTYGRE
jgi:hypothetical protein